MAKILVIDDDSLMRKLIVRTLQAAQHEVIEATDGDQGLQQFSTHRPVLVVTDILMPEKEGVETIRELRRAAPSLPILAISGNADTYLPMAMKLGATAALAKPFQSAALIEAVNRLLTATQPPAPADPTKES